MKPLSLRSTLAICECRQNLAQTEVKVTLIVFIVRNVVEDAEAQFGHFIWRNTNSCMATNVVYGVTTIIYRHMSNDQSIDYNNQQLPLRPYQCCQQIGQN